MQRKLFLVLTLLGTFLQVSCKNYLGNPYSQSVAARVVPVDNADLRVEPMNWWTGMKLNRVEILLHRAGLASYTLRLGQGVKGIKLVKVEKGDSPNYLFATLEISPKAPAQKVPLVFTRAGSKETFTHEYPILKRNDATKAQGVGPSDVIYLLMPDRFANGDPSNDEVPGMAQRANPDSAEWRHGGDLKGIADHLDYLQDLGITALWLNPELENDQPGWSYHGYAVTDHYRVDRRFGSNEQLRELINQCHKRGIKFIRDVVLNHIGLNHYWMHDLPCKDWVNQWPAFTRTTYRAPTLNDPYASEIDKKYFSDGWFDTSMPDLNQRNPHLANYLIQQAIWWIEYAGIDDLRIDTYTYSDQAFCSRWCKALRDEYPHLGMFGEIWEHAVPIQGFYADDQPMKRAKFDSNLPGVVDFQVLFAFQEALNREAGWTEGIMRLYYVLSQDYFYKDPYKNVVMLDNHDFDRFYSAVGENFNKYKSGMAFLLTTRGIPQIYYMTEILATGKRPSDSNVRKDFPGGWPRDPANKFTAAGRTAQENEAFNYARTLIRYRNANPTLQTGKLMQFVPADNVYVFFRYDKSKTIMTVINTANKDMRFDTRRFAERMDGFTRATDVVTGAVLNDLSTISVEKNGALVLELGK